MADLEDALRNADAAGDTNAARQLADEIVRRRGLPPAQAATTGGHSPIQTLAPIGSNRRNAGGSEAQTPLFELETPDGKKYEVEAPDEYAAVRAFKKFQTQGLQGNRDTPFEPSEEPANEGPMIEINGRHRVRVSKNFLSMTPEQQNATIDEIAQSIEALPGNSSPLAAQSPQYRNALAQMSAMTRHPTMSGAAPAASEPNKDEALYVMQSADRGLANALGAPVDLATLGINLGLAGADRAAGLFGGSVDTRIEKPVLGSEWIKNLSSSLYEQAGGNVVPSDAVPPRARMVGGAVEGATSALLTGGGLASAPVQAAAKSSGALGRFLSPLASPYEKSARALAGDAAAGVGAGASLSGYEEYASDDVKEGLGALGPVLASLGGGIGGATTQSLAAGAKDLGLNTARRVVSGKADPMAPINPATGQRSTRAEMEEAARAVQAQASNPKAAAAAISENAAPLREVAHPGELPTSGAISDDVGLGLLEREMRARNPKPFLERDQATNARAGAIVRDVAPAGAASRDFSDAANAIQRQREVVARTNLDAARAAERDFADTLRRQAEPVSSAAGQRVTASQRLDAEIVDGALRPMQDRKNTAFAAIDPNRDVVRDATPLIDAAADIRDSLGRLNDPSSVLPTRTLDRIAALSPDAGGDGTITFGELNALRPELSSALVKARAVGDFALADNIQRLQTAIHRETDRLAGEATSAGRRAAEAQRVYREEFAPTWNVGPGDEATRFRRDVNADRQARTQSPPSATASRFLRPGQPEKAASLRRIIDTLPDKTAAQSEARRFLVSDLAESGVIDASKQQLRPDALRRWRNQWGDVLDVAPGFKAEVDNMLRTADDGALRSGRLANDVRAAEAKLDDTIKNKGALGLVLGKDPVNAVTSIFNSGDPEKAMNEIVSQVGSNARAKDGLKAAVVEYLTQKTTQAAVQKTVDGSRPVDFSKLENLFNRHEKTLASAFSPEEMNTLRQAHKLLKPQMIIKESGAAPLSLHDLKKSEQAWRLLEGGLKARYGHIKGGGILRTIRIFVASLPNRDDAVQNIVLRVHFDPELAAHLLSRDVKVDTPVWNSKLNRLLAVAAGAREAGAGAN
jgi:hypothetical protein